MVEPEHDNLLLSRADAARCLDRMAEGLQACLQGLEGPLTLVGLETGGVRVADALYERLPAALQARLTRGALDANFYRDDYAQRGLHASKPSRMPLSLDGHVVALVDDVLFTGRTVRAAMNALFDFGRPQRVLLLTLIERPGRELPIAADVVGCHLDLSTGRRLSLGEDLSVSEVST